MFDHFEGEVLILAFASAVFAHVVFSRQGHSSLRDGVAKYLSSFVKSKEELLIFKYLAVFFICGGCALLIAASFSHCDSPHMVMISAFTLLHTIEHLPSLL